MKRLEFANAQLNTNRIHSWGKISINFDICDEPHDKYYQHQGHKAG